VTADDCGFVIEIAIGICALLGFLMGGAGMLVWLNWPLRRDTDARNTRRRY